jgi:hypothetical protein
VKWPPTLSQGLQVYVSEYIEYIRTWPRNTGTKTGKEKEKDSEKWKKQGKERKEEK